MKWRAKQYADKDGIRTSRDCLESDAGYLVTRVRDDDVMVYVARDPQGGFVFGPERFTDAQAAKAACDKHQQGVKG